MQKNKSLQNAITEDETPIEEAPRSTRVSNKSAINAEQNLKLQNSEEVVLHKQTYMLPDLKRPRGQEGTVENILDTDDHFERQKSKVFTNIGSNLDHSTSFIHIDSSDEELNSELSEESNSLKGKKKNQEDSADVEETFRKHFIRTFQGIPRISQISLDEPSEDGNEKIQNIQELNNTEDTSLETSINQCKEITDIKIPSTLNGKLNEDKGSSEET